MPAIKRTLTKAQQLTRIDETNPNEFLPLNALALHIQVLAECLKRRAQKAGVLCNHPTKTLGGKPIAAIKGANAVPILREAVHAQNMNRRKGIPKTRTCTPSAFPKTADGLPKSVPGTIVENPLSVTLDLYGRFQKELSGHPPAMARAVVSELYKRFCGA